MPEGVDPSDGKMRILMPGFELPEEENDGDDFSSEPKVVQLDKLFDQAAAYTREHYARKQKYPSISDFQSTFGVGYPRAKKIVAQLIREGVMED